MSRQTYSTSKFVRELKAYRHLLPKHDIKTIRGQALGGDLAGAKKGLETTIKKVDVMTMAHRQAKVYIKLYDDCDYRGQMICSLREGHRVKKEAIGGNKQHGS